jgi:hypothetical protein
LLFEMSANSKRFKLDARKIPGYCVLLMPLFKERLSEHDRQAEVVPNQQPPSAI